MTILKVILEKLEIQVGLDSIRYYVNIMQRRSV